ncbi:MAG: hypothetical protein J6K16_00535 [Alphaproteobacteria bacterium]|nr:hypothetical protein [Alphaproteobacteria bacterium]
MTEINLFENYAVKDFDVIFQNEVCLETDIDVSYIKSGEEEIQNYVDEKSKPEIDNYVTEKEKKLAENFEEAKQEVKNYVQEVSEIVTDGLSDINSAVESGMANIDNSLEKIVTIDDVQTILGDKEFSGLLKAVTPAIDDISNNVATTEFINGFNLVEKGTNYLKFANGFLIQWGKVYTETEGNVTFPLPFNTTTYTLTTSRYSASSTSQVATLIIRELMTTGFSYYCFATSAWHWLAIGF